MTPEQRAESARITQEAQVNGLVPHRMYEAGGGAVVLLFEAGGLFHSVCILPNGERL